MNLKDSKGEKQLEIYKGTPIKLSADYSTKTLQARREWQEIFQVLKSKCLQPKVLYPAGSHLKWNVQKGVFQTTTTTKRPKEYISFKPALQDMLKGQL